MQSSLVYLLTRWLRQAWALGWPRRADRTVRVLHCSPGSRGMVPAGMCFPRGNLLGMKNGNCRRCRGLRRFSCRPAGRRTTQKSIVARRGILIEMLPPPSYSCCISVFIMSILPGGQGLTERTAQEEQRREVTAMVLNSENLWFRYSGFFSSCCCWPVKFKNREKTPFRTELSGYWMSFTEMHRRDVSHISSIGYFHVLCVFKVG